MSSGFSSYPQGELGSLMSKLEQSLASMPKQEAKVAQYMLLNLNTLGPETGKSLSEKIGVTEVTVGRLMRRLGYNGTKHLKELLREHYAVGGVTSSRGHQLEPHFQKAMEAELSAIRNIFEQTNSANWEIAARLISDSERVYVTGFQTVRGLAEDFARRLSLARPDVRYLSPHDGMLGEWLSPAGKSECLLVVDVVPYASEAMELSNLAKVQGRSCIVVSDEFCHWSAEIADACIYAPSNTGMFLESTTGLNLALALLIDHAARSNSDAKDRLNRWKKNARKLKLF